MEAKDKVIIGGIEYRPITSGTGANKIVIVSYGWIFVGQVIESVPDKVSLTNASVVRKWSNGKGIGALASIEHKEDYALDQCSGDVTIPIQSVIATIDCQW